MIWLYYFKKKIKNSLQSSSPIASNIFQFAQLSEMKMNIDFNEILNTPTRILHGYHCHDNKNVILHNFRQSECVVNDTVNIIYCFILFSE